MAFCRRIIPENKGKTKEEQRNDTPPQPTINRRTTGGQPHHHASGTQADNAYIERNQNSGDNNGKTTDG
ncbi:MAG: hypothetical protein IIW86_00120 [Clostridia bacterium]|jgi:hypothetical protein|nr:hypothetical protein [Clostridia bacterium]